MISNFKHDKKFDMNWRIYTRGLVKIWDYNRGTGVCCFYEIFIITNKKKIIDYKTVEGLLSHVYPDLGSVLASPHKCQNQLSWHYAQPTVTRIFVNKDNFARWDYTEH